MSRPWAAARSLAALSFLALTTCTDLPTATGARSRVALKPVFTSSALRAVNELAAFSMNITNLRIVLVRPVNDTLADTTVAVNPSDSTVELIITVRDARPGDVLDAGIQFRDGDQVLFEGSSQVTAQSSAGGAGEPTEVPTTFVGPGATAVAVSIAPRDTAISDTGSVAFRFAATDANGDTLTDAQILWQSVDESLATIDSAGVLRALGVVGTVRVIARTIGGLRDSALVTMRHQVPTHLVFATAPSTTANDRNAFATQPVVQVTDQDDNPVQLEGVVVTATLTSGGGSVIQEGAALQASTQKALQSVIVPVTATTDAQGVATFVGLALAGKTGAKTITFSSGDLTVVTASVVLKAGDPQTMAVSAGDNQTAFTSTSVATDPSVVVKDADANVVPGADVSFAVTAGGGQVSGANPTTSASGIARVGSWTLGSAGTNTLTASSAGVSDVVFTATAAQQLTSFTLAFCASRPPLWIAYQNDGEAWQQLTLSNNEVTFDATEKLGLAYVYDYGAPEYDTIIYYGTTSELAYLASPHCLDPVTASGTIASAGVTTTEVDIGYSRTFVNSPNTTFSFPVDNQTQDILVSRTMSGIPDKYILRRLVDPSAFTGMTFDFSLPEAVAPDASHTFNITGATGGYPDVFASFVTPTMSGTLFSTQAFSGTLYSIPSGQLLAGDGMSISATVLEAAATKSRQVYTFLATPANVTLALGPLLSTPTVTAASNSSSPYVRLRMQLTSQSAYANLVTFYFWDPVNHSETDVWVSAGYFGGTPATWDITTPDFTGTPGFDPDYMVSSGTPVDWAAFGYSIANGYEMTTPPDGFIVKTGSAGSTSSLPTSLRAAGRRNPHQTFVQALTARRTAPH